MSEPSDHPDDVDESSVDVSTRPVISDEPAIVCTLTAGSMQNRLEEWQTALTHVERRELVDDGLRLTFSPSLPVEQLARLAAAEQDCCQFFRFSITFDSRGVALEVRAPPSAADLVTAMFGAPS